MADLSTYLQSQPVLAGWYGTDQLRRQQNTGNLADQLGKMKMIQGLQNLQRQQKLQDILSSTNGNPAQAIPALVQSGFPQEAAQLHNLIQQPKILPPGAKMFGPDNQVVAENPQQPKPNPVRTIFSGDTAIQQELQPDGSWKEIGRGNRFNTSSEGRPIPVIGPDQKPVYVNPKDALGKSPAPSNFNLAGSRESVQNQRVIMAAKQASKDLNNMANLPVTTSRGYFGGREQGKSLFEASKETLTNKMTTQEVQTYNVMAAGIQRNLAAIEAAGLMPSGTLTHMMDAVIIKDGDTNLTKLQKLAQIRQIADAGLETLLNNPRVSEEQKGFARQVMDDMNKSVPFTQEELNGLTVAQDVNPNLTLNQYMKQVKSQSGKVKSNDGWSATLEK